MTIIQCNYIGIQPIPDLYPDDMPSRTVHKVSSAKFLFPTFGGIIAVSKTVLLLPYWAVIVGVHLVWHVHVMEIITPTIMLLPLQVILVETLPCEGVSVNPNCTTGSRCL